MTAASVPGSGPAMIWCPFADEASADGVAKALLAEGLVACANILAPMRSLFAWNGELGEAIETGVVFKTDAALLDRAINRIVELHPYEEPAVLGWRTDGAAPGTRAWLGGLLQAGAPA